MEEVKETCKNILFILENEFPNQQYYRGIIQDIHTFVRIIYTVALRDEIYKNKINVNSLIRQFVDETTHFSSPALEELEKLGRLLA